MSVRADGPDSAVKQEPSHVEMLKHLPRGRGLLTNEKMLQRHLWPIHEKHYGCPWPNIVCLAGHLVSQNPEQPLENAGIQQMLSQEIKHALKAENMACLSSYKEIFNSFLDSIPNHHLHGIQQLQKSFARIGTGISGLEQEKIKIRRSHEIKLMALGFWMHALLILVAKTINPESVDYLIISSAVAATLIGLRFSGEFIEIFDLMRRK